MSRNVPLFQHSDQVSGFIFLATSIYYSLSIFSTYSPPEVFNYSNREREVEYADFHLDSSQFYQLGPDTTLISYPQPCKQRSCTTHLFYWSNTKGYSPRALHQQWDVSTSAKLFTGHLKGGQRKGLTHSRQIHKQRPKYHCFRRNSARAKLPPRNLCSQYLCSR